MRSRLNKQVIIDTGFIVALFHEKDERHQAALKTERQLGDSYDWISTPFVIHEIYRLLRKRVGFSASSEFLMTVHEGVISIPSLPTQWAYETNEVLVKFKDHDLDLADASLVILANHLKLGDIVSVDFHDFSILRWGNGKNRFNNLMER